MKKQRSKTMLPRPRRSSRKNWPQLWTSQVLLQWRQRFKKDKDKTDEEDVVKFGLVNISAPVAPCKSLFNGEKVPKVRTKSQENSTANS